jgi:hypothetical protein
MAKDQTSTGTVTNRKLAGIANSVLKDPIGSAQIVIAVDIALTDSNFTRSSVAANLDAAEATAIALATNSGRPTRVTINGAEYQVYSRGKG